MISFLALVGQQTLASVVQGTEIAWKELPSGPADTDFPTVGDLQHAFTNQIAALPSAYSYPASRAKNYSGDEWQAFRVGTRVCGDKMIAYFGLFTFAWFNNNSRGMTPFGLAFGIVLDEMAISFNDSIVGLLKRLFKNYAHEAIENGFIIKPVRNYSNDRIDGRWEFSAIDFVVNPENWTTPRRIGLYSENISTFIARGDGPRDLSAIVSRLTTLMDGRTQFDAFIAMDDQLDQKMKAQAPSGIINYFSIDDFMELVTPPPLPSPATPAQTAVVLTPAAAAPIPPSKPPSSPPPPAQAEPQPASPKAAQTAPASPTKEPSMDALVAPLERIASSLAQLEAKVGDPPAVGRRKRIERGVGQVVLGIVLACGPIALLSIAYDRIMASDQLDQSKADESAKSAAAVATGECLTQAQIVMERTNESWNIILQKAQTSNADVSELGIPDPKQFIRDGREMVVKGIRRCLDQRGIPYQ